MTTRRFPVRFTSVNRAMSLLGLRPSNSFVEVVDGTVQVRMGAMFRAGFPLSQVRSAAEDRDKVRGWGVHGMRGTWLVNGSSSGIVRVEIEPAVKARTLGIPVELRVLRVAVQDPAGLVEALSTPVPA